MASRAVRTQKDPVQLKREDESLFVCSCGSTEFRITEEDASPHMFCWCGQVYAPKDLLLFGGE